MHAPTESRTHRTPSPGTGPWRILVVDDESMVRGLAARILTDGGFVVHQAADGIEALELLERNAKALHLVLSDIVMPRFNGVELLQAISVAHPGLPVILMSGYHPADLAAQGIAAPCSILHKPFAAEDLLSEVRRCLSVAS